MEKYLNSTEANQIVENLNKAVEKDPRRTYIDFYQTFDFYDLYSESGFNLLLTGRRKMRSSIFRRMVTKASEIYRDFAIDYRMVEPFEIKPMIDSYTSETGTTLDINRLAAILNVSRSLITHGLTNKTQQTISCYEAMTLKLIPNKYVPQEVTNDIHHLRLIKRTIMRAMLNDGNDFRTIDQLAQKIDVDVEVLKNPERLCHNRDKFFKVYDSIINNTSRFDEYVTTKRD